MNPNEQFKSTWSLRIVQLKGSRGSVKNLRSKEPSLIDQNQNKKKRGRKKGSKNRPKEIIEAEKQIKRRKSDSEGPKMMLARKKSIDPAEAMSEAPNLPTNGETTENEFLCGWCKKLFASPVGRMRHSMHCNWNPDRISSKYP